MANFTSSEMLEMAYMYDHKENNLANKATAAMLRQAADMMERKEKRNDAVEYGIQYRFKPKGIWYMEDTTYDNYGEAVGVMAYIKSMCDQSSSSAKYWRIVRREVSGWEEVKG